MKEGGHEQEGREIARGVRTVAAVVCGVWSVALIVLLIVFVPVVSPSEDEFIRQAADRYLMQAYDGAFENCELEGLSFSSLDSNGNYADVNFSYSGMECDGNYKANRRSRNFTVELVKFRGAWISVYEMHCLLRTNGKVCEGDVWG